MPRRYRKHQPDRICTSFDFVNAGCADSSHRLYLIAAIVPLLVMKNQLLQYFDLNYLEVEAEFMKRAGADYHLIDLRQTA